MKELLSALVAARAEITAIPKDAKNHFKGTYATIDGILESVVPALCKHGLVVVQAVHAIDGNNFLLTTIYHVSGESLSDQYPLPALVDSQKFGGAITYARRYALSAMLCLAATDDPDAATATEPEAKATTAKKSEPTATPRKLEAVAEKPDTTNTDRLKAVAVGLGIPDDAITAQIKAAIAEVAGNVKSVQLTPEQVQQVIRQICINWGFKQGVFNHANHVSRAWDKMLTDFPEISAEDSLMVQAWHDYVEVKIAEREEVVA
jgi:hypothetical protein